MRAGPPLGGGPALAQPDREPARTVITRPDILLVEDNPDTVSFLVRRLEEAGYDVRIARNGQLAREAIDETLPSAVIMDINLPILNGDELVRELRRHPRTVRLPVVFVTAESEDRVSDLLHPGHTLCLEKAIRTSTLLSALSQVLEES